MDKIWGTTRVLESAQVLVNERLIYVIEENSSTSYVQSFDLYGNGIHEKALPGQPACPPEFVTSDQVPRASKVTVLAMENLVELEFWLRKNTIGIGVLVDKKHSWNWSFD
ncbi:hypothetical protein KIW84_050063 [Lathyrus oleraceus]|uniref:Uncharacterized protein n=1 Tax=Pisum sativum TaxID=3888 RepID=A0A9D5AE54_PEA|nr:hypothetical protein KIW84_050063 [Pisum sativum]